MSQPTNTKLMDVSPGGESPNQYESATSFTQPNTEGKPNFGDARPLRGDALAAQQQAERERAAHRAENRRFGEAISEHGFGGETCAETRDVKREGEGGGRYEVLDEKKVEEERRERRWMGYGEGSGVGG